MKINCRHCKEAFIRKRRNQGYCSASCRTMACYKRNRYEYVSGSYKKNTDKLGVIEPQTTTQLVPKELDSKLNTLLKKEEKVFDTKSMTNTVVSNLLSDTAVYGMKKILNPKSLPATKGDVEMMLIQIQELQQLLIEIKFKNKYRIL